MSGIDTARVAITTAGSSGSASGSGATPSMKGYLLAVWIDYTSMPATTDVTITYGAPAMGTILTATNTNTDTQFFPRKQAVDNTGTAITGVYDCFPLTGTVSVSVAQADAGTDSVIVYFVYQKA